MQNNNPLNKVVFIQKVAAFIKMKTYSLNGLLRLAYVNNSWNDTIKNYSYHLFEKRVCGKITARVGFQKISVNHYYRGSLEDFCDRAIKSDVVWFVDVLLPNALLHRANVAILVCKNESLSLEMAEFMLVKIVKAGGADLLKRQLTATEKSGWNCLMFACYHLTSKAVKLVFDKIVEVGGKDLLKTQLAATDPTGETCLMLCCSFSESRCNYSSPEVVKLVFEKIVELGGIELLGSQLTLTNNDGLTCLMVACSSKSSSPEVVKLVVDKIIEVGGKDLLKSQIIATDRDGSTCLMLSCCNSSSPEVMKVLFEKIFEVGGTDLLSNQLSVTSQRGWNCLGACLGPCSYGRYSPEVMRFLTAALVHLSLFNEQYPKLDCYDKKHLKEKIGIDDASWVPDPEIIAEVKKTLNC